MILLKTQALASRRQSLAGCESSRDGSIFACSTFNSRLSQKPGGGGGGGSLTIRLATQVRTRVQKKRRKGSVFRYTASKGVVDVSPEKGVFFSSLSPFRGPISQSRFRGVLTPFDINFFSRGYNLKDWSSINSPFYMFIWCLIPCRAHLLTDNDI